jgi:hypothetical protein
MANRRSSAVGTAQERTDEGCISSRLREAYTPDEPTCVLPISRKAPAAHTRLAAFPLAEHSLFEVVPLVLIDGGDPVARQYGLILGLPAQWVTLDQEFGIDLAVYHGDDKP